MGGIGPIEHLYIHHPPLHLAIIQAQPTNHLTDITGPQTAKAAIIFIYDIFGPAPQILQGADRLAEHTSLLVVMPDFFEGKSPNSGWFPVDTDEKKARFAKFREDYAGIEENGKKLLVVRRELTERWKDVEGHVGVFGLCWGGEFVVG
jgi:dienelactone hydrolase